MRTCVIFNPVAKGDKARRFRRSLDAVAAECTLKRTSAPGEARQLAADVIREGCDTIIAAGGDGTLNEVLNGIGDVPDGFESVRLGVLPLGTVNVFARELKIPMKLERAWEVIQRGRETHIDLPCVEFGPPGTSQRRYFAQLAGAGLDARAIELVDWPLKKKIGPLAYVVAGLEALRSVAPGITATGLGHNVAGELVLIGNGRRYGGPFRIFPNADLHDGLLDVCVFPRANWLTLVCCAPDLLLRGRLPARPVRRFQAGSFTLTSPAPVPFEVDGELAGHLPATFSVQRDKLRLLTP